MSPEDRCAAHLWDMLQAAKKITAFTEGVAYEEYLDNEMMRDAVERNLGTIGEAARRLSEAFREAHQDILWRKIIDLRNVVVHQYDNLDQDEIWVLVTERVPELIKQLEPLVPAPPSDPEE